MKLITCFYFLLFGFMLTYSYSATKLEIGDAFSEPVIDFKNQKAYVVQNLLNGKLLISSHSTGAIYVVDLN